MSGSLGLWTADKEPVRDQGANQSVKCSASVCRWLACSEAVCRHWSGTGFGHFTEGGDVAELLLSGRPSVSQPRLVTRLTVGSLQASGCRV